MPRRKGKTGTARNVGKWKVVDVSDPYITWEKQLPGGGRAQVLFGDTGPQSDNEWWSHLEYSTGNGFEWAPDRLPAGDDRETVIARTMEWMRKNQDWKPEEQRGGAFDMGFGLGL